MANGSILHTRERPHEATLKESETVIKITRDGEQKGKKCNQQQISFSWALKSLQMVTAAMKLKDTCSLEEKLW